MDRRGRAWKQLTKETPPPAELLAEEIDGESYAIRNEPRCRVCSLREKDLPNAERVAGVIDQLIIRGSPYKPIVRHIHPLMTDWPANARPGYNSIRSHARLHLRLDETLIREIVERRAREQHKKILDGVDPLITRGAVLEAIVQVGMAQLASGLVSPKVKDVVMASEALEEIAESNARLELDRLKEEFDLIIQVIHELVSPEIWAQILTRVDSLTESRLTSVATASELKNASTISEETSNVEET